jgi:hypothetical protein
MVGTKIGLEAKDFERLVSAIQEYGDGAEEKINETLHGFGAKRISDAAKTRIHPSGRKWRGKKKGARYAEPFTKEESNLSVLVRTKSSYGYLYFPDDGSNSRKHAGQQHFMRKGAEEVTDSILIRCIAALKE